MGKDKYKRLVEKICKKEFPSMEISRIEVIETNQFIDGKWEKLGNCIFLSISSNQPYNMWDIENFVESCTGDEVVVSII